MIRRTLFFNGSNHLPLFRVLMDDFSIPEKEAVQLIEQGSVWFLKRRLKDANRIIPEGEIEVFYPHKPIVEYTLSPELVRFEDDDIMLVYKEGGINTCPSPFSDYDCLSWGVQKYLNSKGSEYTVSSVHRLDKPAQGLVFFAKHKEAEKRLHHMFLGRRVKKVYLAVIPEIENPPLRLVIRDEVEWRGKVQEARSFIRLLKAAEGRCYYAASPLTGRPHQLRKHFAKYIAPIIGDAQYGPYTSADELQLAAFYYRFIHPMNGKKLELSYLREDYRKMLGCGNVIF